MEFAGKKKILIIRISSLGDILLTTPVIRSLKNQFPENEISFLVDENFSDAIKFNPNLSKLFYYDKETRGKEVIGKLKNENFDFVIDLQNNIRSKNVVKSLKAKSVKFVKPTLEKFLLVKFKLNLFKKIKPIPLLYASSLGENFVLDNRGLDFYLAENLKASHKGNRNKIAFCPGSQHFTKQYPLQYFIELGNKIVADGFELVLLGGKNDREICAEISSNVDSSIDKSNDNDLFEIAREMEECTAVVCNDSGLMHLATAVGVPTLSIFGSTVEEFGFFPYKARSKVIQNNSLSCRPCSHIGKSKCPERHFQCMISLTPDLVYKNLKELIEEKNG